MAASREDGLIPPGAWIDHSDVDAAVVEWWSPQVPSILVWAYSHRNPDDVLAFWKENLPRRGWTFVETNEYTHALSFERCACTGKKGSEWIWSKQTLELSAYLRYPKDPNSITEVKVSLRSEEAVDWPTKWLGVGVSAVTLGWMGEFAQLFGPVEQFC